MACLVIESNLFFFLFHGLTKNYRSATLCLYVSNKFLVFILFLGLTKNYRSATLCLYVSNKFLVFILFLAFKIYKKL